MLSLYLPLFVNVCFFILLFRLTLIYSFFNIFFLILLFIIFSCFYIYFILCYFFYVILLLIIIILSAGECTKCMREIRRDWKKAEKNKWFFFFFVYFEYANITLDDFSPIAKIQNTEWNGI